LQSESNTLIMSLSGVLLEGAAVAVGNSTDNGMEACSFSAVLVFIVLVMIQKYASVSREKEDEDPSIEHPAEEFPSENDEPASLNETDSGYWLTPDRDYEIIPTERTCFYCCTDGGKVHPLEHFTCYPCCGYKICIDCMRKNAKFCGECLTQIPYNENALLWVKKRPSASSSYGDPDRVTHLLGMIFIRGSQTYLDELILLPLYDRRPPPSQMLAIMNPPNIQTGVNYLTSAAEHGVIAAMLELADTSAQLFTMTHSKRTMKRRNIGSEELSEKGTKSFLSLLLAMDNF